MLIKTPDFSHRYYGWRESAKLVSQIEGSISDISALMTEVILAKYAYETQYALVEHITEMDSTISALQSARVTLDYIRQNYKG